VIIQAAERPTDYSAWERIRNPSNPYSSGRLRQWFVEFDSRTPPMIFVSVEVFRDIESARASFSDQIRGGGAALATCEEGWSYMATPAEFTRRIPTNSDLIKMFQNSGPADNAIVSCRTANVLITATSRSQAAALAQVAKMNSRVQAGLR
jgi:hypothetical protein